MVPATVQVERLRLLQEIISSFYLHREALHTEYTNTSFCFVLVFLLVWFCEWCSCECWCQHKTGGMRLKPAAQQGTTPVVFCIKFKSSWTYRSLSAVLVNFAVTAVAYEMVEAWDSFFFFFFYFYRRLQYFQYCCLYSLFPPVEDWQQPLFCNVRSLLACACCIDLLSSDWCYSWIPCLFKS